MDGAGLNLYGPTTGFYQALTINSSLVDTAQANLSLSSASPLVASVPVNDTTNGQYLSLPVLAFDVNAQNDTLHLRQVNVNVLTVQSGGSTGSVGAAYLYQGSTQIASASLTGTGPSYSASFSNISNGTAGATIPVNTTVPFWVKVDVTGVTAGSLLVTASTTATQTILSSNDSTAIINGTAQGNTQTVAAAGPLFTLVGAPMITRTVTPLGNTAGDIKYEYQATFNVNIQAIGQNVLIGLPASTTCSSASCSGASFGSSTTGIAVAQLYESDVASTTSSAATITAGYAQPSNTTLTSNTFTVSRNQSVSLPINYRFTLYNVTKSYGVQMQGIYTNGTVLTNFMANQPAWRTNSI